MPAVVRGGRRQSSGKGGARGAPSGRAAEIGRLDMSPRVVAATLVVGVGILAAVLATGARAERISTAVSERFDAVTTGMGLKVRQVHVTGASPEAEPSIRQALGVYAGQPITSLDLDAIRAAGHPTATAIIVTNGDDMGELKMLAEGDVLAGTPLFKF